MTTETAEFAETARRALAACAGLDIPGQARRLAEDGMLGVLAAEEAGGLGLDLRYAVPVATAAGTGLIGFPLVETMLLAASLPKLAESVASGELTVTVAWAGRAAHSGGRVNGTVGRAPCAEQCGAVLVRTNDGGAALVRTQDAGVSVSAAPTLDVDAPEYEVTLSGAEPIAILSADAADSLWSDALVLRAAAMLGAAEACLAMATEHVSTRQQFGRKLVAFQAIRHALARQKLGIENIRAAIDRSLALTGAEARRARLVAFAAASQWGPAAVENALQLHGGMGFTWEVPIHRHLRQMRSWEAQGGARTVRMALADALLNVNA
jgi:alkylation response protein AidB-like acyl-CoA dehydrogenase